jgi:signal transduction histidine kinase
LLVLVVAGTACAAISASILFTLKSPGEIQPTAGRHVALVITAVLVASMFPIILCLRLLRGSARSLLGVSNAVQEALNEKNYTVRPGSGAQGEELWPLGDCINQLLSVLECQEANLRELAQRLDETTAEERKAAAAATKLSQELMLTSRQAGMAEVATGVLHNVGNVLNSINVSATLIGNRLRQSRVNNLGRVLGLLREHRSDLGTFLNTDPKGKMVPGYLETLTDHLAAEQAEMSREMEVLAKNVEHVKEIVAMQQSYARLCGVSETLQVSELVQDAIRMNLGAFERHSVTIVQEFAEVPPVTVDKHKVLQILINLMRNAKYAMDELGPPEKRLTIGICAQGKGHVVVSVRDNGIGIARDNLQRIFGHGFTTKQDGHGFGLHSGALAAREMGGRLTATSDGIGKGAVFCLELPVAQVEPNQAEDENRNRNADGIVRT